jgi:excisionase family DNA binding protein
MKKERDMNKQATLRGNREILTPDEAAEFLRVSRRTINHLIAAEAIPFVRIGNRVVRFRRQAVMKWLREENTQKEGR